MNSLVRIDLFKLIDEKEKKPGSWVMARGEKLNGALKAAIESIALKFSSKRKFRDYLAKKFDLSQSVSERFVWLMKEWHPIFLIKEIADLAGISYFDLQDKIDYLKMNHPPLKIFKSVKELSEDLCKIAGAHAADGTLSNSFIRITDGYESNLVAFNEWIKKVFGVKYKIKKVKDSNEWAIAFHSGIIARYLNRIFDFPSGMKQYTVGEPEIIKKAPLNLRKSFAIGALTFEAGVGMKHQVDLCVASKDFRDSIADILILSNMSFTKMEDKIGEYWRLSSNNLTKEEALVWRSFLEPDTEKWLLLRDYIEGYKGKVNSFEQALISFDRAYPSKSASKVDLKGVLSAIRELSRTHRYELVSFLCKRNNLSSYGGKWAHSLMHYLKILRAANAIFVTKEKFGKKKSFGSIIREVYHFNPKIEEWNVPIRNISAE